MLQERITPALTPFLMPGRPALKAEKQLLVFLSYLSNTNCIREIANLYNLSLSTVHDVLLRVAKAIVPLKAEMITWPNDVEQEAISLAFNLAHGLHDCIGCIGLANHQLLVVRFHYGFSFKDLTWLITY